MAPEFVFSIPAEASGLPPNIEEDLRTHVNTFRTITLDQACNLSAFMVEASSKGVEYARQANGFFVTGEKYQFFLSLDLDLQEF